MARNDGVFRRSSGRRTDRVFAAGVRAAMLVGCLALAPAGIRGPAAAQETVEDEGIRYIDVTPVDVPLTRGGFIQGHVVIRPTLKVETPAARARVQEMLPKLEARFLMAVSELARYDIDAEAPIDTGLVRARLQQEADAVLGAGIAQVFIIEAMTTR